MDGLHENLLKSRLLTRQPSCIFGVRSVRNTSIVAMAQAAGYEAIYVDFQHSPIDMEAASNIFQAALHAGVTSLARISHLDPPQIGRLLDAGAHGLMVADIRTGIQARELVRAALLAPLGDRSFGLPLDPRFPSLSGTSMMEAINRATLLVAMIESEEGVAHADAIVRTDGIDAIQVGSSDLSADLGIPGQFAHPRMIGAYETLASACRAAGKPFIVGGLRQPADLARCLALGAARCYFTGSDTAFVLAGARAARERAESADREGAEADQQ